MYIDVFKIWIPLFLSSLCKAGANFNIHQKSESFGRLVKIQISLDPTPWIRRSRVWPKNLPSSHVLRYCYWPGNTPWELLLSSSPTRPAVLLGVSPLSLSSYSFLHLPHLPLCFWSSVGANTTYSVKCCMLHTARVTCFFPSQQPKYLSYFLSCHYWTLLCSEVFVYLVLPLWGYTCWRQGLGIFCPYQTGWHRVDALKYLLLREWMNEWIKAIILFNRCVVPVTSAGGCSFKKHFQVLVMEVNTLYVNFYIDIIYIYHLFVRSSDLLVQMTHT